METQINSRLLDRVKTNAHVFMGEPTTIKSIGINKGAIISLGYRTTELSTLFGSSGKT